MRSLPPRRCLSLLALLASLGTTLRLAGESVAAPDRIALAVIFDTSGSMEKPIATRPGAAPDAKYRIAQRAFAAVIDRLEAFTRSPAARPLDVGIYVFRGTAAVVAQPLAPFDPARLRQWLATVRPGGATPLGDALFLAGRDLLAAPAAARHILVLTDGANTTGRQPATVLENLATAGAHKQTPVFTHIIALDIAPRTFDALKKHGVTLIGAADEAQLNAQFDFILEQEILVEAPR